jgi:hypothetical protein
MKKLLTLICCLIFAYANAQQEKLNVFHLVDSATNKPIIVSVAIVRAKLSITTEKDGVFSIPGDLKLLRDTIIFSAQNFNNLKMPLNALFGLDTLRLSKVMINAKKASQNFTRDTLLNDFKAGDINYFAGIHSNFNSFEYRQLAQQFYVDTINTRLRSIKLHRLQFDVSPVVRDGKDRYAQLENSKFRIRVYDIDAVTGGPGKDLCNTIIEYAIGETDKASINLAPYDIIIPNRTFFIAIEWLRDYYNAHAAFIVDYKNNKPITVISYKPAIGISPLTGKKTNIWGLNIKQRWEPFTDFAPFGTDLAIKATVEY